MKTILELTSDLMKEAFEKAGYDGSYGKVSLSNRPDLCEYQCNGAMAAAKVYKKAPIVIANDVIEALSTRDAVFETKDAVNPGFINLKLAPGFVASYLSDMTKAEDFGIQKEENPNTVIVDYGGANVAKPLHIGHLRSAIIGESVKRIVRAKGNEAIGDIHLGDWGYQMGLIINEVEKRQPDLPYFDDEFEGEYPTEPPFTISELGEIYPLASETAKNDENYKKEASQKTFLLQNGHKGYYALWQHIMSVSLADLKVIYEKLNADFELWKGEADVQKYIPEMVEMLKEKGIAYYDDGALVVDVNSDDDKKELPPCIILKSDGGALYATTDLATLVEREKLFKPNRLIYLTDKRQDLHFTQVFRVAKKAGIVPKSTALNFIGFGTMNGKDGKPFKTRDGGVMRLEYLIGEVHEEMLAKIKSNKTVADDEAEKTAKIVGLAALKYGDLSNQASKDYVFDIERFTSFEGNTGPYILYTIVRIKSILSKHKDTVSCVEEDINNFSDKKNDKTSMNVRNTQDINDEEINNISCETIEGSILRCTKILEATSDYEKALMLEIAKFSEVINIAYDELAPHKICAYIYELANAFNKFYHETKILTEENEVKKNSYINLLELTKGVLERSIDILGFEAPERM